MTETSKCPKCGTDNDARVKYCISCSSLMPGFESARRGAAVTQYETLTDSEYLKSIDRTLKTIKTVALWFLALSIAGLVLGILSVALR
jgi:hypothetical protein